MTAEAPALADGSAAVIAALVRSGRAHPRDAVKLALRRITALDERYGAFQLVRAERAVQEAEALAERSDIAELPLAGVPLAIKDNIQVRGEPMRLGSRATSDAPSDSDHTVVARLRSAGAIVVGLTRLPELGLWGITESDYGVTRNPWNTSRTPGGSSGGAAAAVAAGMIPVAHGNDGLGSIRIPAAACGLFGIKPGLGVVPAELGVDAWFGMIENGPITTTVGDAALMLSVMAERPDWSDVSAPQRPLRVALSTRSPALGVKVDSEWSGAAERIARLLESAGHHVAVAHPPVPQRLALGLFARWTAGAARDAALVNERLLLERTRAHARVGRLALRMGLVRESDQKKWRQLQAGFFERFDILLTPALACSPPKAGIWNDRSWIANVHASMRFAPFGGGWNYAGFPAAAVPAGIGTDGMPLSVQIVAAPGGEPLLLSLAHQIELMQPWPRTAPVS